MDYMLQAIEHGIKRYGKDQPVTLEMLTWIINGAKQIKNEEIRRHQKALDDALNECQEF
jgi:hypothetical protein